MATTAIFAEILIAGFEAAVWLSLLVFGVFWTKPIHLHGHLKGWEPLVTIVAVGFSYALGVLADRLSDSGHRQLEKWWRLSPRPVDQPVGKAKMRLVVLREGGNLGDFLEYQQSRVRVARATALNCVCAGAVMPFVVWRRDIDVRQWVMVAILLAPLAAAFVSEWAYRRIEFAYLQRLTQAYRLVTGKKRTEREGADSNKEDALKKKNRKPDRGAAVPYRRRDGQLELLLVEVKGNTSDSPLYTFPKGRFDPKTDKTLADTAEREAREEAGVKGRLDGTRLGHYTRVTATGKQQTVAAFALEVKKEGLRRTSEEHARNPGWFLLDEAQSKLSDGDDYPECITHMKAFFDVLRRELGG